MPDSEVSAWEAGAGKIARKCRAGKLRNRRHQARREQRQGDGKMLADEEGRGTPVLHAQQNTLSALHHTQGAGEIRGRSRQRGQKDRAAASKSDERWYGRGRDARGR